MNIFYHFIRKFLPLPCPLCRNNEGTNPNSFCPECRKKLKMYPENDLHCPGCGGPMTGALAVCLQCLAEPERPWKDAISLMPYHGTAREAIRDFKFHNRPEFARAFGMLIAEKLRNRQDEIDLIVPVPLHFMRRFSRGYNQSMLLAAAAGSRCNIPVAQPLKRVRKRSHQSRKNRLDRHRELAGSFILTAPDIIRGRRILLIDDVITTGATLHAAARTLLKGEPESITILTLARTPGHSAF